jgi:putative spermidine/putrescine transport system ATP-binding protein
MTKVSIQSLGKRYGTAPAVDGISLDVQHGEFISLLGPSGCGKTTTLKCLAGFESVDQGRILFDDTDVSTLPPEQRDIGMVFQSYALFPHMTVQDNLAFGLEMRRVPRADIARRVNDVMALVQLEGKGARYPRELSGGQQQRVALARALVIEPRILLLDEPLANLDATLRNDMRTFIRDLQRRVGITTLYVTHDQAEAMTMSDRVVVMFNGRIAQADAPERVYARPASAAVASFVGQANLLEGTVRARVPAVPGPSGTPGTPGGCAVQCASGVLQVSEASPSLREGAKATVMARPEAITLRPATADAAATGELRGTVAARYFHGAFVDYRIMVGEQPVSVQAPAAMQHAPGDAVWLCPDPARLWILPEAVP